MTSTAPSALRSQLPFAVALLIAAVAGAAVVWLLTSGDDGPTTRRVQGVTNAVNRDGTAIGLTVDGGRVGQGFTIAGADWQDCSGAACGPTYEDQGARPGCVTPLSRGQALELLLVEGVEAPAAAGEDGRELAEKVVFVRCLSKPAEVDSPAG